MASKVSTRILDNGLGVFDTEADAIFLCSQEPMTFLEATSTYALGSKNFGVGNACGAPAAGSPTGRKVTTAAVTDGACTANGTATRWAIVDTVNSRLLGDQDLASAQVVTNGNLWTLPPFNLRLPSRNPDA